MYLTTFHKSAFSKLVVGIPCSLILSIKNGEHRGKGGSERWRGLYLKIKTCSAWRKSFANDPLVTGCFHLNSKFILKSSSPVRRCKNFMWYQALCLGTQTSPVNRIVLFHVISCFDYMLQLLKKLKLYIHKLHPDTVHNVL